MGFYGDFAESLTANVTRRSISSCAEWAERYRMIQPKTGSVNPELWDFKYYPWLREMHDSKAMRNVGQKAAQMGYTELLLNWAFFKMDIRKQSVLYVLPTDDNAGDFSSTRFDPAIESSPHLTELFSDTKNKGLKRSGISSLYIRGSRAKNKLISIPVGNVAIDELDQMVQEHIELIWERMSGQFEKQSWSISTPTVKGYGINKMYSHSTDEHLFFKCPSCSRTIELLEENLEICGDSQDDLDYKKSRTFCLECKATLPDEQKFEFLADAKFEAQNKDGDEDFRGFHVSQLYSSTITSAELALSALKGREDDDAAREYNNSKLGKPFVPSSYKLNDEDIDNAKKNYVALESASGLDSFITMGIDIGTKIHYVIEEWTLDPYTEINENESRVLNSSSVNHFEELDDLMSAFKVNYAVIDANPERRASIAFCKRFAGRTRMCFYGIAKMDRDIDPSLTEPIVSVNRAMWMDLVVKKFKRGLTNLPANISIEFQSHMTANVKIVTEDPNGNIKFKYDNLGRPDHSMHAKTYSEIALKCAWIGGVNKNIEEKI